MKNEKLSNKYTNNPINKWEIELNKHFSNEEVQKSNKYLNKCSTS